MSLPVSIGDVLIVVNATLGLYKRIRNAPAELIAAKHDIEQVRTILEALRTKLRDKTSVLTKQRKIALIIQNALEPLTRYLAETDIVLQNFTERRRSTMTGRVRYAILDKKRLQDLKNKLSESVESLQNPLSLLNTEALDVLLQNDVLSQRKLDEILQEQRKEALKRRIEAQKTEQDRQVFEQVLKLLEQRSSTHAGAAAKEDQYQILDQLEIESTHAGATAKENQYQILDQLEMESTHAGAAAKEDQYQILDQLEMELKKLGISSERAHDVRSISSQEVM